MPDPLLHRAPNRQTAIARADSKQLNALIEQIVAVLEHPWEHDEENGDRFISVVPAPKPLFGFRPEPDYVFFSSTDGNVVAKSSSNRALNDFFALFVAEPAATCGLNFEFDDAEIEVPADFHREPILIPHIGQMNPIYNKAPSLRFDGGWITEPEPLACMNGLPVSFLINEEPFNQRQAEAIGQTIRDLRSLGPTVVLDATDLTFAYYQAVREHWTDEDCRLYDIPILTDPEEVWANVAFPYEAQVWVDLSRSNHVVDFDGQCLWEVEHGIRLRFENNRITEVGACH